MADNDKIKPVVIANDNGETPKHLEDAAKIRRMYRLLMSQLKALPSDPDRLTVIAMMAAGASLFAARGDKAKAHDFLGESFVSGAQSMLDAVEADFHQALHELWIQEAVRTTRPNRFIPPKKD